MNFFLLLLILNVSFIYCRAQDIEALKNDPDIIIYKNVTKKIKTNTLSHYYVMPPNIAVLQGEIKKNPSPDNMKIILKKNGMIHANEFVDNIVLQRNSMLRFNKRHPEFRTMDPIKRMEIIKKLLGY